MDYELEWGMLSKWLQAMDRDKTITVGEVLDHMVQIERDVAEEQEEEWEYDDDDDEDNYDYEDDLDDDDEFEYEDDEL